MAILALSNDTDSVVSEFLSSLSAGKSSESVQLFCLLSLGEIGRRKDLSHHTKVECKFSFFCTVINIHVYDGYCIRTSMHSNDTRNKALDMLLFFDAG